MPTPPLLQPLADWEDVPENPLGIGALVTPLLKEIADLRAALSSLRDEVLRFEAFEGARGVALLSERVDAFESFLGEWKGDLASHAERRIQREAVRPLLAGVDALVRAQEHLRSTDASPEALQGIGEVVSLFDQVLSPSGFTPIEPLAGEVFNPECHQAMGLEKGDGAKVVRLCQRGWSFLGKVIRPAEVIVGNGKK